MRSAIRSGLIVLGAVGVLTAAAALATAQGQGPTDHQYQPATVEERVREHRRLPPGRLANAAADILGVPRAQVVSTLARGGTLAELAKESGSSGEELSAALLARLTEWIEEAVANDRIGEVRGAEILAAAPERIERFVNTPHRRAIRQAFEVRFCRLAAEVIGVTPDDLREKLVAGATLEDVAAWNGVSVEELVDGLTDPIAERLERAVANGRISQEDAEERLEELAKRITERVGRPFTRSRG